MESKANKLRLFDVAGTAGTYGRSCCIPRQELEKISQSPAQTADLSREMVLMQLIKDATTALANLNAMGAR